MGATNTMDRVAASMGAISNVPSGGVLMGLPALLAMGLLRHAREFFQLPAGYFLLLAFMALARIKTIEALRYCAPGEWGKLLGLDRIPEVRTLRGKIRMLSAGAEKWSSRLCAEWMESDISWI